MQRRGLKSIANNLLSIDEAIDGFRNVDLYPARAEVLRYFMFRYEEHLATKAGQRLNESQWNKIWADEPAKSIEHIKPQSSGVAYLHRLGNLTMLPPGTNSKLKDSDPQTKVTTYETCGLLETSEIARSIKQSGWSAKTMESREEALLKWARTAWKT